jgi:signal transduction histidine kinase
VTPAAELERSLGRFITFDQTCCLAAVGVMASVYAGLHRTPYLLVLIVIVGVAGAVMGLGRRPLARGDLEGAVLWVAGANWAVAVGATAVATFCVPITAVAAILPSVLAVPYVGERALRRISIISMGAAVAVVAVGTLQDFSGMTGELQPWLPPAVLLAFVPFVTGLVVMVSAHNSARIGRALDETLDANRRLRSSEADLRQSRARLVVATDRARQRIARDLHDGAQQHLIALSLRIQRARRRMSDDDPAKHALAEMAGEVAASLASLRELAHGVYPAVLTDRGLAEALIELAARTPGCRFTERSPVPRGSLGVEASVYWCCTEAVQNFVKHAGDAAQLHLTLSTDENGDLLFEAHDDGAGFDPADATQGQGLVNMADRIGAVGGELTIVAARGRGVHLRGHVPSHAFGPPSSVDVTGQRSQPSGHRRHGRAPGGAPRSSVDPMLKAVRRACDEVTRVLGWSAPRWAVASFSERPQTAE